MGTEPQLPAVAARRTRGPTIALAAIVIVAACVYAGAAQLVSTPRVHPDEHIYWLAGAALAAGDGLTLRGEDYGLGPVYPAVLAGVLTLAPDRETAYHLAKVANALLFALAAIPIFLVARRLLTRWWSVGVAAMSLAVPSSLYVSLVMTESVSYFVFSLAIYAIVLALERSTVARQLFAIAAIVVAYETRAQFAVLFAAYLAALVVVWVQARDRHPLRSALAELWPSLAALVLGIGGFVVRPLVRGDSPADAVGAYSVLFRGYDPLDIVKWIAYLLTDLEVYLAIVPIAVAPIVISRLWRRGREGSRQAAAFVAAFAMVNGGMLFVTAAFSSTVFGFDRLHDRNLFYLAPLWLVVLGVWLADGLPKATSRSGCRNRGSRRASSRSPLPLHRGRRRRRRRSERTLGTTQRAACRRGRDGAQAPGPAVGRTRGGDRSSPATLRLGLPSGDARKLRGNGSSRVGPHRRCPGERGVRRRRIRQPFVGRRSRPVGRARNEGLHRQQPLPELSR